MKDDMLEEGRGQGEDRGRQEARLEGGIGLAVRDERGVGLARRAVDRLDLDAEGAAAALHRASAAAVPRGVPGELHVRVAQQQLAHLAVQSGPSPEWTHPGARAAGFQWAALCPRRCRGGVPPARRPGGARPRPRGAARSRPPGSSRSPASRRGDCRAEAPPAPRHRRRRRRGAGCCLRGAEGSGGAWGPGPGTGRGWTGRW